MLTETQIRGCASGCHSNDWRRFAANITRLDPILGRVVQMHADAADGNSPDVADWIAPTVEEADRLRNLEITTPEAAEVFFLVHYTDDEPDEDEADDWFRAVYGRDPDNEDRQVGIFSLVCAGV